MSKRKSRRPWMSSVGVVDRRELRQRRARRASAVTAPVRARRRARSTPRAARDPSGSAARATASSWTSPDFESPCGASAVAEVRPRDHRDDRLERNAGDGRVPDRAAAERDAERADLRVGDLGPRREPGEELLRVQHVARPVEPERAARRAVPARVARRAPRSRPARGTASRAAPCPGACRRGRGRA